jgi:hypothetical protein
LAGQLGGDRGSIGQGAVCEQLGTMLSHHAKTEEPQALLAADRAVLLSYWVQDQRLV